MESQPKEMRERGHHTHVRNNREWVGLLTFLFSFVFFLPRFIKAAYTTAAAAIIEDNDVIIHRNDGGGGSPLSALPTRLRKS